MKTASPKPTLCISSISSSEGGSSTESAISAWVPSRVRETAMLAMLSAVLTEERADLADHPGDVVVAEEHHVGLQLDVDPEAESAREEEPRLRADRGARDLDLLAALGRDANLEHVHVVARGAEPLLADGDPALGREQRGVDVVDVLVDPAAKDAIEGGDREQARVVVGDWPVRGDDDAT